MVESRQNFKLSPEDEFINLPLLNNIIENSNIPKAVVEESSSELWYETLHGHGTVNFKNGVNYVGNLRYGIMDNPDKENPCLIEFPNGTTYKGTMSQNELTGEGIYTFSNGSTYEGRLKNGLRDGYGIYKSEEGIIYEGYWKEGLKHGKGKIQQGNMELEGEWEEGILSGKCRIKWKSGNVYDGNLKDNAMNGNGYMIWYNKNEKYSGQWENNLQNGFGIHIWYEKKQDTKYLRDRYIGQWKNGKREGYGKFFYSNGSIYEGYWRDNKKEGFGVYTFQDRSMYRGNFKGDIMVDKYSKGSLIFKEKSPEQTGEKSLNKASMKMTKNKFGTTNSSMNNNMAYNANNNTRTNQIKQGLEVIKENETKEKNEEKNLAKSQKEKEARINKKIDEIKIYIDIADLIDMDPKIKEFLKPLDNLLLRNLSLLTHLYLYACGKEDIKTADVGLTSITSNLMSETKGMFKKQLENIMKKDQGNLLGNLLTNGTINTKGEKEKENNEKIEEHNTQEEKKEKEIDYDNVYNNDLYFCLDFKQLWKFIRDCGLITSDVSLAMIDRLYYQSISNQVQMYFLPVIFEKENKNPKFQGKIYDYIFQKIQNSKNDFDLKYRSLIDQSNIAIYGTVTPPNLPKEYVPIENYDNSILDYHSSNNIILLRNFYELMIRLAYLRFNEEPDIEHSVNTLINTLKSFFKAKRKACMLDSSLMISNLIDPKIKNYDSILENFINNHYNILDDLFSTFCKLNSSGKGIKKYDMTLTYNFLYYKVILKNDKLRPVFRKKLSFIDLICIYHSDKKVTGINLDNVDFNSLAIIKYIEKLFRSEMIFREFCEMIFFISRKYFDFYKINTEKEDNKGRILTKEEEEIKKIEEKKNKKKKKKQKETGNEQDDIDIYQLVLNEIIKTKSFLLENTSCVENLVDKITFPKLRSHIAIEKILEEERIKKLEEERKEKERIRMNLERQNLKEESEYNAYQKTNEEQIEESGEYSDIEN